MKYIITLSRGIEVGVVFSELLDHDSFTALRPISAGFCSMHYDADDNLVVQTFGKSTLLKLQSRPEDAEIIQKTLAFRQ